MKLLRNGEAPILTHGCTDGWTGLGVELRGRSSGAYFRLGFECDTGFQQMERLPWDTYDVRVLDLMQVWDDTQPLVSNLPRPPFDLEGAVIAGPSQTIVVDVREVQVSGSLRRNGTLPVVDPAVCAAAGYAGQVRFSRPGYPAAEFVFDVPCGDPTFSFSGQLYPGAWKVEAAFLDGPVHRIAGWDWGVWHQERFFETHAAFVVSDGGAPLLLDVPETNISGTILLNGAAPLVSSMCDVSLEPRNRAATVELVRVDGRYRFKYDVPCDDPTFSFSGKIFPGEYRATVSSESIKHAIGQGSNLPAQRYPFPATFLVPPTGAAITLDVPLLLNDIEVRVDGVVPTVNAGTCPVDPRYPFAASVFFSLEDSDAHFNLELPCEEGAFSLKDVPLYPGRYEVSISEFDPENSSVPHTLRKSEVVLSGGSSTIDFDTTRYETRARLLWNGKPVPSPLSCASDGVAATVDFFRRPDFDSVRIGFPCADPSAQVAADLLAGTHDVRVTLHPELSEAIGAGKWTSFFLGRLVVSSDADVTFELETRRIDGEVRVDGEVPHVITPCSGPAGTIRFDSDLTLNWGVFPISCDPTGPRTFTVFAPPGVHDVYVRGGPFEQHVSSNLWPTIPRTEWVGVRSLEVR